MGVLQALGLIELVGMTTAVECADAAVKTANVQLIGYELSQGGLVTIKLTGNVAAVQAAVAAGVFAASRIGKVLSQTVIPRPYQELDCLIHSAETVTVDKPEPPAEASDKQDDPEDGQGGGSLAENQGVPEADVNIVDTLPSGHEVDKPHDDKPEDIEAGSGQAFAKTEDIQAESPMSRSDAGDNRSASPETEYEPEAQAPPEELPEEPQAKQDTSEHEELAEDGGTKKATCNICGDPQCPRIKGEPRTLCLHYNDQN